jgi:hypothetical protein
MVDGEPGLEFADPWRRLLLALNEFAAHLVVTTGVLGSIRLARMAIEFFCDGQLIWFKGTPFGPFDAEWLFQASDSP